MTDTQDLIARLRTDPAMDCTTLGNEAADALEAAQAEIERLIAAYNMGTESYRALEKERNAALARLAELEKQEPVAVVTAVSPIDFIARVTNEDAAVLCIGASIYAAAGASPVQPSQVKQETWTDDGGWEFPVEQPSQALELSDESEAAIKDALEALEDLIGEHYGERQSVVSNKGRRAITRLRAIDAAINAKEKS